MPGKNGGIIIFLAIIIAICAYFFVLHSLKPDNAAQAPAPDIASQEKQEKEKSPDPEKKTEAAPEEIISEKKTAKNIPEKFLLDIPFYSQAPLSKWDAFHEDMCEEASLLNAAYFLLEKKPSLEKYEKELEALQKAEKKEIGEWKSTTVSETKKLVDIYSGGAIKSKVIDNPSIEDIESEVAAGNPVIIPLAGRDIGNPNFTPPGPIYHMLVVKGYDSQNFITNDVGTRKGNSYVYSKEVIMKNMHDWNEKEIHLGEKRILVLYR